MIRKLFYYIGIFWVLFVPVITFLTWTIAAVDANPYPAWKAAVMAATISTGFAWFIGVLIGAFEG